MPSLRVESEEVTMMLCSFENEESKYTSAFIKFLGVVNSDFSAYLVTVFVVQAGPLPP